MSITSRINEMSSHIEQAYDELQGLGADLTNVNKNIENISMVLDDIYDSMPQVSGDGTNLTLDDTRVGKIKSTLKGNTSQTGTPTPTSPIPVNVVSGDNEINVEGKNLLNYNVFENRRINCYTINDDKTITQTASDANQWQSNYLPHSIILNSGTYTISVSNRNGSTLQVYNLTTNSNIAERKADSYTFTLTNDNQVINVKLYGASSYPFTFTMQIEKGSSASTYEPYQGNTYNIDLPEDMELCKIGTYQDYFYKDSGKWYLHKEIGKVVFNGSEVWQKSTAFSTTDYSVFINNTYNTSFMNNNPINSNYFINDNQIGTMVLNKTGISYSAPNYGVRISIEKATCDTIEDFKSWLSTHNTKVYYVLATPINTEITYQPLIDQLNLLEKAMSKDGQTNISQVNNDLPFIISASALKEWQENTSLNSTLSMVNPLSLGNTLNTQENNTQPIEVDNIEPLEEEENEES